uniref:Uncharacterized protein n=1 Tax=viral metagenome TaxID=1070528 RepID=A0A6H1ZFE1_9ZZZZ
MNPTDADGLNCYDVKESEQVLPNAELPGVGIEPLDDAADVALLP